MTLKRKAFTVRITAAASLLFGLLFFFTMLVTNQEQKLQLALLGFLLGASLIWLVYLALWFISRGVSRTMFPAFSRLLTMKLRQKAGLKLSPYQEKMCIETIGAFLTIASFLGLAALALFILSGMLYIAGRLTW